MTNPLIGYENFFRDGTVSVTSAAAGFEAARAYDGFLFDGWKPASAGTHRITVDLGSAKQADYWAIFSRDLGVNGGSVKPQYSTDNFVADTNDFDTAQSPSSTQVVTFRKVTAQTKRYWRFEVISTPASVIQALAIGKVLELNVPVGPGFALPTLVSGNEIITNVSQDGQNLGRTRKQMGVGFDIDLETVEIAWMRANWRTLLDTIEKHAFFFSWDQDNNPGEAVFAWLDGQQREPAFQSPLHMRAQLALVGMFR